MPTITPQARMEETRTVLKAMGCDCKVELHAPNRAERRARKMRRTQVFVEHEQSCTLKRCREVVDRLGTCATKAEAKLIASELRELDKDLYTACGTSGVQGAHAVWNARARKALDEPE